MSRRYDSLEVIPRVELEQAGMIVIYSDNRDIKITGKCGAPKGTQILRLKPGDGISVVPKVSSA